MRAPFFATMLGLASVTVVACSTSDDDAPSAPTPSDEGGAMPEAGPPDAPVTSPTITVTTRARPLTSAEGAKTSATWAAIDDGGGTFVPLAAKEPGVYAFDGDPRKRAWTLALACASADGAQSTVSLHRRALGKTTLDVELDAWCVPAAPEALSTITGTMTNVSKDTTWLDFGYALNSGGSNPDGVVGTTASFAIVDVANGTWDFAFGVRDDFRDPFTKVLITRGQTIAGDATITLDAAKGFVPTARPLVVRGIAPCDTVEANVRYTMNGAFGIDVGPQDIPTASADATVSYGVVPSSAQMTTDRYRASIGCIADRGDSVRRSTMAFHDAADLDVSFLEVMDPPVAKVAATAPYLRLEATAKPLAAVDHHDISFHVKRGQRRDATWLLSTDDAALDFTMPDLSKVAGFQTAWALVADGTVDVSVTAVEKPSTVGDGTAIRTSTKTVAFTP